MSRFNALDERRAELSARFPGWRIWYVYAPRRVTWHAQPGPLLAAESPEELAELIAAADPGAPPG